MEKKITIKTSGERYKRYYKIAQYSSNSEFYCYEIVSSGFSNHLKDIGKGRNYEDAISIIRGYATQFGSIEKFEFE